MPARTISESISSGGSVTRRASCKEMSNNRVPRSKIISARNRKGEAERHTPVANSKLRQIPRRRILQ
jgi:hypothetical protein